MSEKQTLLSKNIKFLRKRKGLNQEQLASALNIKRSNIAAYEAKNVEPRLRIILEMAKLFDVDLQTFLLQEITNEMPIKSLDSFKSESSSGVIDTTLNKNVSLKEFVEKSMKIKKILDGLKSFYQFRKDRIIEKTPEQENVLADIENFIMLMEHLLSHNENLVKSLEIDRK
ncbi:MAG: helix-turn-helix transcriptional regulator [Saprospiraceae bacterium]|nr:helix-turn-helix domain-containing protein [Bacteroidia bacterium]NNE14605.1 helix-turn-helix transcriptional regulator [Saprospiraceae bacterium]NNL92508.1 helix-turn-helix transcriptional regulator [Saprospiraceae bacterium]